ncbi:MaoC-like domain-containing protein [Hyphomicrobiales bacterium]|nr:MaoC-like domain-containing protein [Hyphomicrobiales bacterium]CAH1697459.1 MaoC-like domain-containing protein [Hyphomicrobiales bacterium]CAI0345647.1 MaoC-like domain-containing protein [Hyphomicrobiales bacterium]
MLTEATAKPGKDGARWLAPGATFAERELRHDAAYQEPRLRAAGIRPERYGAISEAGLFGLDCFDSMNLAGLDIDGYVFLAQSYRQIAPVALGQAVRISGHVRHRETMLRGVLVDEIYRFTDGGGRVLIETELTGLLADPLGATEPTGCPDAPALPRRSELAREGWEFLTEKRVTPDDVRVFSQDVGNEIHFDTDFAARYGFRAPLAQGIMSAVWLLSALADEAGAPPATFHAELRYLRPVFWDAAASLWVRRAPNGTVSAVESRNEDGKVTADLVLRSPLSRLDGTAPRP